ncbi:hypothetical protein BK120_08150 [Paenibacillus sp. FSL A5-0031]|uniref:tyrosine-type recombinase/integrase n=1 Tax=Paenibacillus sp. FSL A5-0031 TaxID=1920420 RepID=UPI00096EBEF7|nr:tyrosine-type recombinase/integrase [Paenibacillus sp. FSL A5-0031]OME86885.1 hypothetical protein BK120_08150 [Paenibacillus sp. FSL A5-0031]
MSNYTLADAFTLFYNAKKAEGVRARTAQVYIINWGYFTDWIAEDCLINSITAAKIREYVTFMFDKTKFSNATDGRKSSDTLAAQTIITRLMTIKTIFNFLAGENYIPKNPVTKIKLPRYDRKEKITFTDDDVRKLIGSPNTDTPTGLRDRALMILLADGGFRIQEALRLTTELLDVKARCIHLPAWMNKNRKPRVVPLSQGTVSELLALINRNKTYFETEYIFLSKKGDPLKADRFRKSLNEYAIKVGVNPKLAYPHQFRSYFCTTYLLNGGDLFTLQRIVSHADIETTRSYVRVNDEHVRDQHTQFSPLVRLDLVPPTRS